MPIPPPALQLIRTQIGGSGSGGRGAVNNYPWPYGRRADRQWVVWGTGHHDRVLFGVPCQAVRTPRTARLIAQRRAPLFFTRPTGLSVLSAFSGNYRLGVVCAACPCAASAAA
jgi:hypothetical protein